MFNFPSTFPYSHAPRPAPILQSGLWSFILLTLNVKAALRRNYSFIGLSLATKTCNLWSWTSIIPYCWDKKFLTASKWQEQREREGFKMVSVTLSTYMDVFLSHFKGLCLLFVTFECLWMFILLSLSHLWVLTLSSYTYLGMFPFFKYQ